MLGDRVAKVERVEADSVEANIGENKGDSDGDGSDGDDNVIGPGDGSTEVGLIGADGRRAEAGDVEEPRALTLFF